MSKANCFMEKGDSKSWAAGNLSSASKPPQEATNNETHTV
eukprot:CAMPEP_0183579160 /NCGR_PEP_ID=MMETSP0371-20130417/143224_1 /TAXON_ID=268820 /ORGANISM="Peridinium aciculiferum, Strain PAER-2" /LENGTH=39 /DNA_ID= /DNA_START= /DNA_END= /DNA_ORIENTATION=